MPDIGRAFFVRYIPATPVLSPISDADPRKKAAESPRVLAVKVASHSAVMHLFWYSCQC